MENKDLIKGRKYYLDRDKNACGIYLGVADSKTSTIHLFKPIKKGSYSTHYSLKFDMEVIEFGNEHIHYFDFTPMKECVGEEDYAKLSLLWNVFEFLNSPFICASDVVIEQFVKAYGLNLPDAKEVAEAEEINTRQLFKNIKN